MSSQEVTLPRIGLMVQPLAVSSDSSQRFSEPYRDLRPMQRFCQVRTGERPATLSISRLNQKKKTGINGIGGHFVCPLICCFCPPIGCLVTYGVPQYLVALHRPVSAGAQPPAQNHQAMVAPCFHAVSARILFAAYTIFSFAFFSKSA